MGNDGLTNPQRSYRRRSDQARILLGNRAYRARRPSTLAGRKGGRAAVDPSSYTPAREAAWQVPSPQPELGGKGRSCISVSHFAFWHFSRSSRRQELHHRDRAKTFLMTIGHLHNVRQQRRLFRQNPRRRRQRQQRRELTLRCSPTTRLVRFQRLQPRLRRRDGQYRQRQT